MKLKALLTMLVVGTLQNCATMDLRPMQGLTNSWQQDDEQMSQPTRQVDMNCKHQCLAAGYQHGLCNDRCGY